MLNVTVTAETGEIKDISPLISELTVEGSFSAVCRTLTAAVLSDSFYESFDPALGSRIIVKKDGNVLFDGFIMTKTRKSSGSTVSFTAYDRGIYLKRNRLVRKYKSASPKEVAEDVAKEFSIAAGEIANPSFRFSRNFLGSGGVSAYDIIMTAYTLAAEQSGESFVLLFKGDRLNVTPIGIGKDSVLLDGGELMEISNTEDVSKMINRVEVRNEAGALVKTLENKEYQKLYGVMQEVILSKDVDKAVKTGEKKLKDNGYNQTVTVENLGDERCITGVSVAVMEPAAGVYGDFFIKSDVHTFKNGLYFNRLGLCFERFMDKKEAGELPKAGGTAGGKVNETSEKLKGTNYYGKLLEAMNK